MKSAAVLSALEMNGGMSKLNHTNAREAMSLIREACRENGAALLLVSHDREVLGQFESVQELGKLNRAAN